jgi:glyoxylase-like metal-dependent hydrolase (beta-lactamase superfamily II)
VDTNGYLVVDEASRQAVAIDAPEGSAAAFAGRAERDGLQVLRLVLTHGHWDHIMDALFFRRAFQCPIAIHPADAPMLRFPQTELFALPFSIPPFDADEDLSADQVLQVGPRVLFAGDTLFARSHGRTDLPGSDPAAMGASLTRLAALPPDTTVYSGHGPSTTIAAEADWIHRLRFTD